MQYPCQLDLGCAGTPLKRKHFIPGLRSELMSGPPPAPSTLRPPAPTHHTLAFTPYRPETDISRYTLQARSQTLAGTPYRPDPAAKPPASAGPCLLALRDPCPRQCWSRTLRPGVTRPNSKESKRTSDLSYPTKSTAPSLLRPHRHW